MTESELHALIAAGESFDVEFKGEARRGAYYELLPKDMDKSINNMNMSIKSQKVSPKRRSVAGENESIWKP